MFLIICTTKKVVKIIYVIFKAFTQNQTENALW